MTKPDRFAIIPLSDGPAPANAIAVGPLSMAMEYLPQSLARDKREREADNLAMQALKTVADANLRADAVIEREREVKAREEACRAIQSDAIRRFVDDVLELSHRLDEFEQRKIADALAALPNPEAAPDDGDLEQPKEAKTEVETVLGDQNPGDLPNALEAGAPPPLGSYPTLGRESPQMPQPTDISLNAADDATPAFICGRDRRAWLRRNHASCR
jgi:hypothetical protein